MVARIVLFNAVLAAANEIIPYTGSSKPIPLDVLQTFQQKIALYSSLYVVVAVVLFSCVSSSTVCASLAGLRVTGKLKNTFTHCLLTFASTETVFRYPSSYLLAVETNDADSVDNAIGGVLAVLLARICTFVASVTYAFIFGNLLL